MGRRSDKAGVTSIIQSRPVIADELQRVTPTCFLWQAYCPSSRVDLTSHALAVDGKLYFIDPIRLSAAGFADLEECGAVPAAVILTNGNHERDTMFYWNRFNIPVYADPAAVADFSFSTLPIPDRWGGLEILRLPGAGPGEIAIFQKDLGLLILGDIVINLDSFSFAPLPDRYASDLQQMRTSLLSLPASEIQTICFAHGLPVTTRAGERLAALQESLA